MDHFRRDEGRRLPCIGASPAPRARCAEFQHFLGGTAHDNVGRADQLAGSPYLSGSAKAGESCQLFNAVDNRLCDIPASGGIDLLHVFNSGFKFVGGFGCPPNEPHD
jgi:hypothetical protein